MTPLSDYFIIGDLHTTALVSRTGSIDWLCLPHIDSASVFARLLDEERGGSWQIEGIDQWLIQSAYLPQTAVVEHQLTAKDGAQGILVDYMLPRATTETEISHYIIRQLQAKDRLVVTFRFSPRPDYARQLPMYATEGKDVTLPLPTGTLTLHLPDQATVRQNHNDYVITVTLAAGENARLILEYIPRHAHTTPWPASPEQTAITFWQQWVSQGKFFDFCREELIRSAITLKLLQFYPTGAITAAATMSLPAVLGGPRNWDYRYVWIRDASFTLYAFYLLGFTEEAHRFFEFIEEIVTRNEQETPFHLHTMYDIWGNQAPTETELDHLRGYADSTPVRLGNAATDQFQLDMYGSLIDAYYFMSQRGVSISKAGQNLLIHMADTILDQWQTPDYSIWEIRQIPEQYTYSKVMSWVGLDRATQLATTLGLSPTQRQAWQAEAEVIARWVWQNCFLADSQRLVQHPNTQHQDASNFMFVLLGFLDRHTERTKKIVHQTAEELVAHDFLVYRYKIDDGIPVSEEAFLICSFWYIAALAAIGELNQAEQLLQHIQQQLSPTGLMSEDIDTETGAYLGNFPQAYSHLGFITAAHYIYKYKQRH